jgi:hypothetical protein
MSVGVMKDLKQKLRDLHVSKEKEKEKKKKSTIHGS